MKLRLRLLLTTLALCLPLAAVFAFFQHVLITRTFNETMVQFAMNAMQDGGRKECEAAPETWMLHGPGRRQPGRDEPPPFAEGVPPGEPRRPMIPPPRKPAMEPEGFPPMTPPPMPGEERFPGPIHRSRIFAYDAGLLSRNPNAPRLDPSLADAIRAGESAGDSFSLADDRDMDNILIRMPWSEGPCAYLLIRQSSPGFPGLDRRFLLPVQFWLLPLLAVLLALYLSVGPVVRRVRRLTQEVKRSRDTRYEAKLTVKGRDEIGELARAFDDAAKEVRSQIALLQKRDKTLRDFLENTTHDVMIPLTVLQGHLSAMMELAKGDKDTDAALVSSAMNETQYIASLIHNLSVAAKIEEGEPSLHQEAVNLNLLIERVMGRHRPLARPRSVALNHAVPEEPLFTLGDVTFIEQAVNNVVYNAIRYNVEGGHVAVILEAAEPGRFALRVIDDGPGIPDEELSRLVERCFRGNAARSREPQGQGLGLNIAYQLALLHHWTFTLRRSEFGGLHVEFGGAILDPEQTKEAGTP